MKRAFSLGTATLVLASVFVIAIDDLTGIRTASANTQAGTLDTTFPGASPGYPATGVAISSTGQIAVADAGLAIYSSAGVLTRVSANESMSAVAVQIAGGVERFLTGSTTMKRYSLSGTLDTTFATGQTGTHRAILPVFSKIYAGATNDFKRYSENGALESTVAMGSAVNALAAQTVDGVNYILVGGGFGLRRYRAADSTQDTSFTQNPGATVNSIAVQADGKILVGGTFGLRRYEADGAVDTTFTTVSGTISAVLAQTDGKILTGTSANLKRYSSTGVPESTFNTNTAKDGTFAIANNAMAIDSSGRIVIAGPSNLAVKRFIRRYSGVYTPPNTPPAPTAVAGDSQVTVTVTSASTGATPTFHTVSVVGDPTKTCTVTGVSGSCTITGLTNGTSYSFQTVATNFDANSAPSPTVSAAPVNMPPVFASALTSTDGLTLTLTYNKDLSDPPALPSAFTVTNGGVVVVVDSVSVSGSTVVLTLASPVGATKAVTVAYTAPAASADLTNNAIQDLFGLDAVSLTARTVSNNSTVDQTPPVFSSATASTDGLKITMTYNEALSASVAPKESFAVTNGGVVVAVDSVSVSGSTVVLTLASPVGATKAVTVAYTAPSVDSTTGNNAVQDVVGNDAVTLTARAVTNSSTVDQTPPVFSSATASTDGLKITMTYNEALSASVAPKESFAVTNGGVVVAVDSVSVSGSTVVLTLASPVGATKAVTVAYTAPSVDSTTGNNAVQDVVGNDAVTLTARAVTNSSTVDQTPPTFSSGVVSTNGLTLTLTYNESLNAVTAPADAFTVTNGGVGVPVTAATISGSTVVLSLGAPIGAGKTATVAYVVPAINNTTGNNAVQDTAGNDALLLTARTVTNSSTVDQTGPLFSSAVVGESGSTLTVTYNEALNETVASISAFIVKVGGTPITINSVTVSGSTIVFDVSPQIDKGLAVTIEYAAPAVDSSTANPAVQDTLGNDATTLTARAATNNSTYDSIAPVFVSAAIDATGKILTMTYNETLNALVAGPGAFTVTVGGEQMVVSSVVTSGLTVKLNMSGLIIKGKVVTIKYQSPTGLTPLSLSYEFPVRIMSTSNEAIQDVAGNDAISLNTTPVTNGSTVDQTPPELLSATISAAGNTLVLLYNETLSSTTAPLSSYYVTVDDVAVVPTARTVSGSSVTLTLPSVLSSTQVVTMSYVPPALDNTTSNTAIQDAAGNDATALTEFSVANYSTTGPPMVKSAVLGTSGTSLLLTMTENLSSAFPAASQFVVYIDGSPVVPSGWGINGTVFTLNLPIAVASNRKVEVSYFAPAIDPSTANAALQDFTGADTPTFIDLPVENKSTVVPDTTPPVFSTATVNTAGTILTLAYGETLSTTTALPEAFTVLVNGAVMAVNTVTAVGTSLQLALAGSVPAGNTVTVAYTAPAVNNSAVNTAVQDVSGNDAETFSATSVTNNSTAGPDIAPPKLSSVSASGSTVVLTFNESLASATAPASSYWVYVGNDVYEVDAATVSGRTVVLTVDGIIPSGADVSVAYTPPATESPTTTTNLAVQDVLGNDAVAFTGSTKPTTSLWSWLTGSTGSTAGCTGSNYANRTKQVTLPNGVTYSVGVTGDHLCLGEATESLAARGGYDSIFTSTGLVTEPGLYVQTSNVGCLADALCENRGILTFTFSEPVTNPIISFAGWGGGSGSSVSWTELKLLTPGVTIAKLSGTNIEVTENGTYIDPVIENPAIKCNQTSGYGATAEAGCGSLQVVGTVSTISFQANLGTARGTGFMDGWNLVASIPEDFGVVPASYDLPVASHVVGSLRMGSVVTSDQSSTLYSTVNPDAFAANTPIPTTVAGTFIPDDGVATWPALSTQSKGSQYTINVALAGVEHEAYLCAWIDFNRDGLFNPAERACAANPQTGATSASITWTVPDDIVSWDDPNNLNDGLTYARVRLSYDALPLPTGKLSSGEVEDYSLIVTAVVSATATNDTSSGNFNTLQTITVLGNDVPAAGATLTSVKLCTTNGESSNISCSTNTLSVPNEGTYVVQSNGTVVFTPVDGFTGTATPVTYEVTYTVSGQSDVSATATITPTVRPPFPVATPETLYLLPGESVNFNNITGDTSLATGTNLQTSLTCLINPATLTCDTDDTLVVMGEGTWTLNRLTGIATFSSFGTITPGTKTAITYQVVDQFGQTATSTLTPIVPPPPDAVNDAQTTAHDTNQFYTVQTNDVPSTDESFTPTTIRLCQVDDSSTTSTNEAQLPNNCTATTVVIPGEGTYTLNTSTGVVTFDPLPSFTGTVQTPVRYQITDTSLQTDSALITPTITPPPLPVATPDTETVIPGGTATFNNITGTTPLATGASLDASKTCLIDPTTLKCDTDGVVVVLGEGTWTLAEDGVTVTFTALSTITPGTKTSITYQVTDVTGQTATSTLTPIVPPPPDAVNDAQTTAHDTNQFYTVQTNDVPSTDESFTPTTIRLCQVDDSSTTSTNEAQLPNNCTATTVVIPGEGTYTLNTSTGVVTFDPLPSFTGTVQTPVRYQITDTSLQTDSALITPTITPPPLPVATPDTETVIPGGTATFNNITGTTPLATGASLDASKTCLIDPATLQCDTDGVVEVIGEGTWTLDTDTGVVTFVADDLITSGTKTAITYQVTDVTGQTARSTLTPIVPLSPIAVNDAQTTAHDTTQFYTVQTNDVPSTDQTFTVESIGLCQITNVTADPPTTVQSPNNCTATTVVIPGEGTYTLNTSTGVVTFDPLPSFTGTVQTPVRYQITDTSLQTDSALITPTITPPPLPVATPDTETVIPGGTATFNNITGDTPLASGTSLDATKTCLYTPGTLICEQDNTFYVEGQGTWTLNPTTGVVTFVADDLITSGTKTAITYQVTDVTGQTARSTLTPIVPSPPDVENDISTGAFNVEQTILILNNDSPSTDETFTPSSIFLCQVDDSITTTTNEAESPDDCTETVVTIPGQGSYEVVGNSVIFSPAENFSGTVTPVTYQVTDTSGQTDSGTISPTVGPPDPPTANNDADTKNYDVTQTYSPLTNDVQGSVSLTGAQLTLCQVTNTTANPPTVGETPNNCTATSVSIPGKGTYSIVNSTVVFDPLPTFSGVATPVTYQITDSLGLSDSATINPTVLYPVSPIAVNDTSSGLLDAVQLISPLLNDTSYTAATFDVSSVRLCQVDDPATTSTNEAQSPDNCTATTVTVAGEGTYTLNTTTGVITFDPLPTFTGTATPVGYQVADLVGQIASATITPTVIAPPTATNDLSSGLFNIDQNITPLLNDVAGTSSTTLVPSTLKLCSSGQSPNNCTATSLIVPNVGTYTVLNGIVIFNPDDGFWGTAPSVTYQIADSSTQIASAIITATVAPPLGPDAIADSETDEHDITQTYSPLLNDIEGTASIETVTLTLCQVTNTSVSPATLAETPDDCTATAVVIPNQGTYTIVNGTVTFNPLATFTGTATPVTYQLTDPYGFYDSATITPTVLPPPINATPDTETVIPGATATFNNLIGDTPLATGTQLQACLIDPATLSCDSDGVVTILGEGRWTLNAETGVVTFATDSLISSGTKTPVTYQVTDITGQITTSTLTPVVPPPPAAVNDAQTTPYDTNQTYAVTGNDLPSTGGSFVLTTVRLCGDDDLSTLDIDESLPNNCASTSVTIPNEGTYTLNTTTGVVTFDPLPTFSGTVQTPVTYQVTDSTGQIDTALITPTITPPPVPLATPDTETVIPGGEAVFNNITGDTPLASGTELDATKTCLIDPSTLLCDVDGVIAVIGEGTWTLDQDTGVVTFVALSTITSGSKTPITYQVTDITGQTATSTLTPVVPPPPGVYDDTSIGAHDTNQTIAILGNDVPGSSASPFVASTLKLCGADDLSTSLINESIPNNCTATTVTIAGEGTYTVTADGTVTFDPLPAFTGTVKTPVTYQVTDTTGQTDSATITPTVTPPPLPVATPEVLEVIPTATIIYNNIIGTTPLATGTDLQASKTCLIDPATSQCDTNNSVTISGEGTWTLAADGITVTFTALSTITPGTKTAITYQVTDITGQTATSTLTPIVPPPPDAKNDTNSGAYDVNQTISILGNDIPSTGDTLVLTSIKLCTPGSNPLVCSSDPVVVPGEGTYTVNADGTVTFNPDETFTGTVKTPVTYQVTDTTGQTDSATITPTVTPPPLPIATPEIKEVLPGLSVAFTDLVAPTVGGVTPLATSTLAGPLTACLIDPATLLCASTNTLTIIGEGVWTLDTATGIVTFAADAGVMPGTKTPITYQVIDLTGQTARSTLTPIVPPPPDALNDAQTTAHDVTQFYLVQSNDVPSSGKTFTVASIGLCQITNATATPATVAQTPNNCTATTVVIPGEGTYTLDINTGIVTFDPVASFSGTVKTPVTYQITDTSLQTDSALITPTITPPPLPTALPDTEVVTPGATAIFNNITGDTPLASGTSLDATKTCLYTPGTLTCEEDNTFYVAGQGTWTIDPATGVVTFVADADVLPGTKTAVTYQVTDVTGQTAISTLTPLVPPPPKAENDAQTLGHDVDQEYNLLLNDTPSPNQSFVLSSLKLCQIDDPATTSTNETQTPNDCSATMVEVPGEGTYTLNASTGFVTFDPVATFTGMVNTSIRYQVTDTSTPIGQTTSALITPTVLPPPVPVATPDTEIVIPGATATFNNITGDTPLATGTLLDETKTCLYAPGTSTCDADNTFYVSGQGTWSLNPTTGVVTFVANPGIVPGTQTAVTYRVTDVAGQTTTSTLTPIVPPPPTAVNDALTSPYDTNQLYSILLNDTATPQSTFVASTIKLCVPLSNPLVCTTDPVVVAGEGTYTIDPVTGQVTFNPLPTFIGTVTKPVTYQVTDIAGQTATATITPTVTPPPVPVATPDTEIVIPGATATFNNITGDTPLATGTLLDASKTCLYTLNTTTCESDDQIEIPGEGTWTINRSTGVVTFVASSTITAGTKTAVSYQVTDVVGQTATSTLTPIVPPPPDATNDVKTDAYDTNQVINILSNDSPSTGATFVTSSVKLCSTGQQPNNCTATTLTIAGEGTYTVNTDGTVTFDPLPTFTGTVKTTVTYQVTDITGQTDSATITPTVMPPPAPTATDDFSVGPYNTSQTLVPISNDTPGADGAPIKTEPIKLCTAAETPVNCSATTVTIAGEGTYTVKPDGGVMFTPVATFTSTATPVLYQTQDLLGRFVFATLNPAVMPPPPPDINDDLQTTAYDINQTYSPLLNDAPGVDTAPFATTSMRLCQVDNPLTASVNEAQQQPSCTATTVTVPGEGTYSITSTGVVVFDPLPSFIGTVATSVTYQITDIAGQVGTATITPTITPPPPPVATPDTEPVLPGQTIAFNNITGATPLATGTQLDSTKSCIVDPATNICGTTVNIPNEGTFTLNPTTGVVSFVALNTITSGTKTSITYKVTDITGQTATSTLTPIVPPPPSATDDYSSGPLDTNQTLTPYTNDAFTSDAPASNSSLKLCGTGETPNTCTKTSLTVPGEGVYTVNANGTVMFDPEPTFVGTATPVRYQATDIYNRPVTATLNPSVTAPSGPVATPETKLMVAGSTASFTNVVGANALATGSQLQTGTTNGPCLIDPATGVCGSTVTIAGEGTWTIDQNTGVATFVSLATITPGTKTAVTYQVTDVLGRTATSTLTPIIPEPPTATNDTITDKYDTNQVYKPLDNDTFSSLAPAVNSTLKLCGSGQLPNVCDALTLTIDGQGTYTVNADGTVTFDPLPTFVGTATSVTYQVSNTLGQTVSATITPTVIAPPLPVAQIDTGTTRQGKSIVFSPWLNDAAAQVSTSDTANLLMLPRTLRFCPLNVATKADVIVVPKANPACTLTKLTTKDGTYTVDTKTGKVTFVHKKGFFGTVTQPVTYQIATNWVGKFGNAHATSQIIPTIVPKRIPAASVGDKVWRDVNGDGYQNKKDRGIPGVKVTLLTMSGKPVTDLFGNKVMPQLTNKDGKYRFIDLPAGQYIVNVKYPPKQRPTIAERPGRERNSSSRQSISRYLNLGQHDGSLDFGMVGPWIPGLPRTM